MSSEIPIPYTVEEHPQTGLYNAKYGIWLFLASEMMLFGGLFSSYILLRIGSAQWPVQSQILSLPLGTANTVILLTSSMTMLIALDALRSDNFAKFHQFLGVTILLALAFLGVKGLEYYEHWQHHEYASKSVFLALYYLLTGVHAAHVIGGIIVNTYFWGPGRRMYAAQPRRFIHRIETAGIYWNFVDVMWILIFTTLYIL